jgi:spectinomycin phosphotransferase
VIAVRDRPAGITAPVLRRALADGWRVRAAAVRYAPVGARSYHWVVRDTAGNRWFVTADDLDDKPWLGSTREAAFDGLRAALDTALALRERAGLEFVAAPVRSAGSTPVQRLNSQYSISVASFLAGTSGQFGQALNTADRARLVDLLAALHQSTAAVAGPPRAAIGLPGRAVLESALAEVGRPWSGGPFAEPARELLAGARSPIRQALQVFDDLAAAAASAADRLVITHGEPHPGNLIWADGKLMLIDWDTVGVGPPERDLWMLADDPGALRRYAAATGRAADGSAIALYRLRWALDDVSAYLGDLRSSHGRTPGAEHSWRCLNLAVSDAITAAG